MSQQPTPQPLCAVTGANGYVGGVIVNALRTAGRRVLALQRLRGTAADADARRYSLTEPIGPGLLRGVDVLVHCAYDFSCVDRPGIRSSNVDGTLRLFEAARAAGVRRIIFISSVSSYEGCRSLYGRAKLEVERRCGGFGAVIVRPGVVYGPGARGMMGSLLKVVEKPVVPMVGSGRQPMLMVHEEDLGRAVVALVERGEVPAGKPIFMAGRRRWTLRELMEMAAAARGRRVVFVPVPWRLIWLALKAAEAVGLRPRTRSDSLVGLVFPDPSPDFSTTDTLGLSFRELDASALR
ncbi:MAG: NAD(P)-dependent oxidoreductase [Planctomycetes bacterium]|nr:NAD(P)-dependent oxidoreductase [Planctomycetota bacterium]